MTCKVGWYIPVNHNNFDRMPASVWIRCLQLIPYLQPHGIISSVNERKSEPRVAVFVRWQNDEALQLARELKKQGSRIVFDLCVNYFEEAQVTQTGARVTRKQVDECLSMLEVADVVTTASDFIAQRAREHHPWVEYLPDSVDDRHFCYTKNPLDFSRPRLRSIWSGEGKKALELEPLLPLLCHLRLPLTLITNQPPRMHIKGNIFPFRYKFSPWTYSSFPQDILQGEICIAHRQLDNSYNEGHSFFKIGVFLAQGIPVIASPVPSYFEVLNKDCGGWICSSLSEWEDILSMALSDPECLVRWSSQARANMQPYITQRISMRYARLFDLLCQQ